MAIWQRQRQKYIILVINPYDARKSYQFFPNEVTLAIGIQHQFSSSTFLSRLVQCIGHNNFTHQYTALPPINFIYIIYPKPKLDLRITKNRDIYFQPINRAKPKWGISIEFGSICNERYKMLILEFKRLFYIENQRYKINCLMSTVPKINLNWRRQYTNFTYKPYIIKAILLTTKYTKEKKCYRKLIYIYEKKHIYPSIKVDLKQQPNICYNY